MVITGSSDTTRPPCSTPGGAWITCPGPTIRVSPSHCEFELARQYADDLLLVMGMEAEVGSRRHLGTNHLQVIPRDVPHEVPRKRLEPVLFIPIGEACHGAPYS